MDLTPRRPASWHCGAWRTAPVLDVFDGAGRRSRGFQRAGLRIDGAIEIDPLAARGIACNETRRRIGGRELNRRRLPNGT